jgi:hypothetical protein
MVPSSESSVTRWLRQPSASSCSACPCETCRPTTLPSPHPGRSSCDGRQSAALTPSRSRTSPLSATSAGSSRRLTGRVSRVDPEDPPVRHCAEDARTGHQGCAWRRHAGCSSKRRSPRCARPVRCGRSNDASRDRRGFQVAIVAVAGEAYPTATTRTARVSKVVDTRSQRACNAQALR